MNPIITICFLSAVLAAAAMATEITPNTPDQLTTAKQKLVDLRGRYADKHPMVQAQLRTIEDLEREAAQQEPAELRAARAKLVELRRHYKDQHPKVMGQLQTIENLERQAARKAEQEGADRPATAPGPKPEAAGNMQPEQLGGMAWEYTLLDYPANGANHEALIKLGKEGWEVSAVLQGQISNSTTLLLKRRKN